MANRFDNTKIGRMLAAAKRIDMDRLFIDIVSEDSTEKFIVKLNTDQMRLKFINSDGVLLSDIGGGYSPSTLQRGKKKGEFSVDLYDTGQFHESFRVENVTGSGFEIKSDPNKGDGVNLLDEWGPEIEGLTFESMEVLSRFLVKKYQQRIKNILLNA